MNATPDVPADSDRGVLPDVIETRLHILFCGTAAGAVSAAKCAYYAGPGNSFWNTLHQVGLTPRVLRPHEYAQITRWDMGLTDLAKHASGSDRVLSKTHFDVGRLRRLIAHHRPGILAFTGKRAAAEFFGRLPDYGLQPDEPIGSAKRPGTTLMFVLPSPSGAARRYWNPRHWQDLARLRASMYLSSGWTQVGRGG